MGVRGIRALGEPERVIFDIKHVFPKQCDRRARSSERIGVKILVTGAAGFIGSHVAASLLDRGDEVVGLDNLNEYYDVTLKHARLARSASHARVSSS